MWASGSIFWHKPLECPAIRRRAKDSYFSDVSVWRVLSCVKRCRMAQKRSIRPLFGREPDLHYLLQRAGTKGVTSIVGRPQSGKTSLLQAFTGRLAEDESFLVGYAESTGQYADLLLRSLQDLYARWLSDSTYFGQAKSLWIRHKETMVTRVGQAVGAALGKVFEAITGAKGTGEALPGVFNSLHEANRDLRSAGIKLPTLDYEQARDVLWVLEQLTDGQMRIVLILDAFDQGEGVEVEAKTIQSFLRHLDDWPECHMFFATRAPEAGEAEAVALKCVKEFDEASIATLRDPMRPVRTTAPEGWNFRIEGRMVAWQG